MHRGRLLWALLLAPLPLCAIGCGDDDSDSQDTDSEKQETDKDSAEDSETEGDTGSEATMPGNACAEYDWDVDPYDYGPDYPSGPYGFKGSLCWLGEPDWLEDYKWGGAGDTIHDICLPNQNDEEVCFNKFVGSKWDLLIVDVSAVWCPVCRTLASTESIFIDALKEAGWNPYIITILEESDPPNTFASRNDAEWWKENMGVAGDVLYDADKSWVVRTMLDKWPLERRSTDWLTWAFPLYFYVDTSTMKIWDVSHGSDYSNPEAVQYEVDLLAYSEKRAHL